MTTNIYLALNYDVIYDVDEVNPAVMNVDRRGTAAKTQALLLLACCCHRLFACEYSSCSFIV